MPATSPAQERLMQAAAHTPGGFGGVSQAVGKEFTAKDSAERTAAILGALAGAGMRLDNMSNRLDEIERDCAAERVAQRAADADH